jgi:aldehyde:ferredoxin oxidoreductase
MGIREFMTIGERIINLGRAFNVREGITRKNDALPKRFTELLIGSSGDNIGQKISEEDLNKMLEEFYALQGWEKKAGVPTKEKLQELGLKFVAKELKDLGYQ